MPRLHRHRRSAPIRRTLLVLEGLEGRALLTGTIPTSTSLSVSPPAPLRYPQVDFLTAQVSGSVGPITLSNETVDIKDLDNPYAAYLDQYPSSGASYATFELRLSPGPHRLIAYYPGDANYAPSTSAEVDVTVQGSPQFDVQSATVAYGSASITLSGTLADESVPATPAPPPAGEAISVTVAGLTEPATLGAGGAFAVKVPISTLSGGSYAVTYSYAGDGVFAAASDSSTRLTITPLATTTLAAAPAQAAPTGVFVRGTTLYVLGTDGADVVQIGPAGAGNDGSTGLQVDAILGGSPTTQAFNQAFTGIVIIGGDGDDDFRLARSLTLPATIIAGDGDNLIDTGGGNDVVTLGTGNNEVFGWDGNKTITAADPAGTSVIVRLGNGNETIHLGNGNDEVVLGDGNSTVVVGNGKDSIALGNGTHAISLGDGRDVVDAGRGKNTVRGGNGSDLVRLGPGHDTVRFGHPRRTLRVGLPHPRGLTRKHQERHAPADRDRNPLGDDPGSSPVGWVERSEAHRSRLHRDAEGMPAAERFLPPSVRSDPLGP